MSTNHDPVNGRGATASSPSGGALRCMSYLQLIVFVVLFVLLLLRSQSTALNDPDTFMHITIGQWILANGRVPDHDIFSFTRSGAPWVPHEWLSDIVLYLVYRVTGWSGLIVLAVSCAAVSLACLFRFMLHRTVPVVYALIFLIVSATSLLNHLLARPHILVWPMLVVWVATLIRSNDRQVGPPYWLLVLMVLWANMHGSYMLGLVLLVPFALEGIYAAATTDRQALAKRWVIFAVLAALAGMVTPYGWHAYRLIFQLLSQPTLTTIVEWSPADFSQINAIEIWIFVLLALTSLGMLRLPPIRLLLVLGLLYQALAHIRYFSIFGLLAPLLIAQPFSQQYQIFSRRIGKDETSSNQLNSFWFAPASLRAKVVAGSVLTVVSISVSLAFKPEPPANIMPTAAVDAAINAGLENSPVFHDFAYGGYLIYRGIPVYIDGRADMYGSDVTADFNQTNDPTHIGEFGPTLDKHQIVWALLRADSYQAKYLQGLDGWARLFQDDNSVVYRRAGQR